MPHGTLHSRDILVAPDETLLIDLGVTQALGNVRPAPANPTAVRRAGAYRRRAWDRAPTSSPAAPPHSSSSRAGVGRAWCRRVERLTKIDGGDHDGLQEVCLRARAGARRTLHVGRDVRRLAERHLGRRVPGVVAVPACCAGRPHSGPAGAAARSRDDRRFWIRRRNACRGVRRCGCWVFGPGRAVRGGRATRRSPPTCQCRTPGAQRFSSGLTVQPAAQTPAPPASRRAASFQRIPSPRVRRRWHVPRRIEYQADGGTRHATAHHRNGRARSQPPARWPILRPLRMSTPRCPHRADTLPPVVRPRLVARPAFRLRSPRRDSPPGRPRRRVLRRLRRVGTRLCRRPWPEPR